MGVVGWPRSLVWSEFRDLSDSPSGVKENAQIHAVTDAATGIQLVKDGNMLRIKDVELPVKVVASDTWVVTKFKSDALLAHEQGHFDICGLVTWEIYRNLMASRAATASELQRIVNGHISRAKTKLEALSGSDSGDSEGKYDVETEHGKNEKEQKRWNDLIGDSIAHNNRKLPDP
jgi:hypothetical protein